MNKEEIEELKDFTIDLTDIDELALGLEVCSKKSNMIIQEFADTIIQLQQENQSLKKENKILRENAENNDKVVDKVNWENQELKSQLKGTTHCFDEEEHEKLKKQLEEWKQHLKCAKEMLDMQGQKGNYDYDEYMLGLYNGMEYIISLFETREPNYISGKDIKFINNKTQQKEFIEYMNKTIEELECDDVDDEEMKGYLIQRIDTFKENLSKFKEIIGCND